MNRFPSISSSDKDHDLTQHVTFTLRPDKSLYACVYYTTIYEKMRARKTYAPENYSSSDPVTQST